MMDKPEDGKKTRGTGNKPVILEIIFGNGPEMYAGTWQSPEHNCGDPDCPIHGMPRDYKGSIPEWRPPGSEGVQHIPPVVVLHPPDLPPEAGADGPPDLEDLREALDLASEIFDHLQEQDQDLRDALERVVNERDKAQEEAETMRSEARTYATDLRRTEALAEGLRMEVRAWRAEARRLGHHGRVETPTPPEGMGSGYAQQAADQEEINKLRSDLFEARKARNDIADERDRATKALQGSEDAFREVVRATAWPEAHTKDRQDRLDNFQHERDRLLQRVANREETIRLQSQDLRNALDQRDKLSAQATLFEVAYRSTLAVGLGQRDQISILARANQRAQEVIDRLQRRPPADVPGRVVAVPLHPTLVAYLQAARAHMEAHKGMGKTVSAMHMARVEWADAGFPYYASVDPPTAEA